MISCVTHSDVLSIQTVRSFPVPFFERNQRLISCIYRTLKVTLQAQASDFMENS